MIRVSVNTKYEHRARLFFAAVLAVWLVLVVSICAELNFHEGMKFCAALWFFGYSFLTLTTAHAFVTYAAYFFVKENPPLSELDEMPQGKSTAIVCPIRNTETGLYERLNYSLNGNVGRAVDCWILSDSDEKEEAVELETVARLKTDFPEADFYYRRRRHHKHFKHGNLAEWLFCRRGARYDYFFILDADSLMNPGTIEKLLRKAEHPANQDIWNFQCRTSIAHDFTHFSHFQKIGLEICERLVFPTISQIFGQWISYGHSDLIRTKCYLLTMPPTDELSHDIWDAAALDKVGYRSVIASDVTVYEEAPANYSVAIKRDRRWAQGSLSALKILLDPRVSLAQRFFVLQSALQYLNNVVFFFWILLGFWNMVSWDGEALHFPVNFSAGFFAANKTLFFTALFAMATFLLHPFLAARTAEEVRNYCYLLIYSNLTMMLNLVNGCFNVLSLLVAPVRLWIPMEKNPFAKSSSLDLFRKTVPASLISSFLYFLAWKSGHAWWIAMTSPMLLGGILSPVLCFWSAKERLINRKPDQEPEAREEKTSTFEELELAAHA